MTGRAVSTRYEILERSGESPLFEVFKTRDKLLGRIAAVKMLRPGFANDSIFCGALRQAVSAVLELSHPNIARTYEMGEDERAPFLVTEFVRGINLKERIRRIAPFTLSVAAEFAIAIAEALQQAHAQGIVHGDLRSQNVIVSPEGAVKVTDFGLFHALHSAPAAEIAIRDRALPYESPEICAGDPPSCASDVYALGVILYEMLTGALPHSGESLSAIAETRDREPAPSPRALNPGVPRALEGIVMKALQKRPEDRYASASDMLGDLKLVRDALRFGKPLSWSPLDTPARPVSIPAAPSPPAAAVVPADRDGSTARTLAVAPPPAEEPQASPGVMRMPATSVYDDRISPYLKVALGAVVVVIIVASTVGIAFWMATFSQPPELKFPTLVGMRIEEAHRVAEKANVRLIEHEEFNDKYDTGVIYRTDWQAGRSIRPGRRVNVWVSKGSRMVWVPKVNKLTSDEAEKKLKAAGLSLGQVDRQFDREVPFESVISQNPRAGKRVNREVAVNLVLSDGPKPGEEPQMPSIYSGGGIQGDDTTGGGSPGIGNTERPGSDESAAYEEPQTRNLEVSIKRDGRGRRRVRIEYDDARGTHMSVDEDHDEGDLVSQRVEVYGSRIAVRVYYGDDATPISEKTMRIPRKR